MRARKLRLLLLPHLAVHRERVAGRRCHHRPHASEGQRGGLGRYQRGAGHGAAGICFHPFHSAIFRTDRQPQAGKTLYHQGDLSYFEAVNKESLKNAFQRFEEEGILITKKSKAGKNPPVLRLSPEWVPQRDPATGAMLHKGQLWNYVESIAISRREGKNRRDSASVGSRVLTLVEKLGAELFADAVERTRVEEEEIEVEVKKGRSRRGSSSRAKL